MLRSKTNEGGAFSISDASEGQYKFKVTKDGFKALSGTIFVDRKAPVPLSFELFFGRWLESQLSINPHYNY